MMNEINGICGYVMGQIRDGKTVNEIYMQAHDHELKWEILAYICHNAEKLERMVEKRLLRFAD